MISLQVKQLAVLALTMCQGHNLKVEVNGKRVDFRTSSNADGLNPSTITEESAEILVGGQVVTDLPSFGNVAIACIHALDVEENRVNHPEPTKGEDGDL